jgi:hypothetical protein
MKENKADNYGNKPDATAKRDQGRHPNQEGHTESGTNQPKAGQGDEITGYTGTKVTDYEDNASDTRYAFEGSDVMGDPIRQGMDAPARNRDDIARDKVRDQQNNSDVSSLAQATGKDTADGLEPKSDS